MSISRLFILTLAISAAFHRSSCAQVVVYSNQAAYNGLSLGASVGSYEWDDLQINGSGTLSKLSFMTSHSTGGSPTVSGSFDLRLFDVAGNRPQGVSLGTFPFSGVFPKDPADANNRRVLIEATGLETQSIVLPSNARLGAGVQFNTNGWQIMGSGPPTIGSSPGGNWLGTSTSERNEIGGDFPWAVSVANPRPPGPGYGTYSLFESAELTPDHPTSNSGTIADESGYSGLGFQIKRRTTLKKIGAFMSGTGTVFAAVVRTTSQFAHT